jgi:hypothetical protein
MRFKIKNKQNNISYTNEPKLGDIKQKIKFSFIPTKINGYIIWLENYITTYEYKHYWVTNFPPENFEDSPRLKCGPEWRLIRKELN